jgi:hypothetical protein
MRKQLNLKWLLAMTFVVVGLAMAGKVKAQDAQLPQPDFSAMEQWYEIIKWSYDDTGKLKIVAKPKEEPPHTHRQFVIRYFDADGVDLLDYNATQIVGLGYGTPAGQLERAEAGAPYESQARKVKKIVVYRVRDDGSLVEPPAKKEKQTEGERADTPKQQRQDTTGNDQNCSFDAPPAVTPNTKFSEQLIKSVLYERYSFEANAGGLSSPEKIGVSVLNIQTGKPYTNTVTVIPGRGAQRKQDGAPPNATIYPFTAKYIVCKKYSKETVRTQYESNFVCFKDRTGNWNCPVDGVPKITYLK